MSKVLVKKVNIKVPLNINKFLHIVLDVYVHLDICISVATHFFLHKEVHLKIMVNILLTSYCL